MIQLTKEYFDQQLGKIATKEDLEERLKPLATKKDLERVEVSFDRKLADQSRQLKAHTDTQVETLRQEMMQGFAEVEHKLDAIHELLDVRHRVETLERQVQDLLTKAA